MHRLQTFILAAALLWAPWAASAQAPGILSHQGKLTVNGTNFTGTAQFKFALVNGLGDTTLWSDNGTSAHTHMGSVPSISTFELKCETLGTDPKDDGNPDTSEASGLNSAGPLVAKAKK